jgi:uncharacterized OB-fold protein
MNGKSEPAKKSPEDSFVFVDARWDIRQTFRRDGLQDAFFDGLRQKKLFGVRDPGNGRVLFPPRDFSDQTYRELSDLVPVGPGGTIRSITQVPGGGPKNRPPVTAVYVQLDGADSAGAGRLRNFDIETPRLAELIGKRCHAVFKDEPAGAWNDYWFELGEAP